MLKRIHTGDGPRTRQVNIRLSEEEHRALQEAAAKKDMGISTFVVTTVLKHINKNKK